VAEPIGTAWLNALRMTIVPLVTSLLIVGIATTAEAANASRLAGRSLAIFIVCIWTSAALAALLTPLFLQILPLPVESAGALRAALSQATQPTAEVPGIADFLGSMIPTNPIAAAANDAILPLIVFTTVFAFALLRLPKGPREQLTGFFRAVADVMLVIIGWVLWLAPIGVFALAFVVGARAGGAAFGALLHYIVIVSAVGIVIWMLAYPLAVFGGRVPLGRFARAVAPSQAVAISTQSSLASLPAMLRSSEAVGVQPATAGVVLPLAVAIFRATGPGMNVAVVLYVAHWYGIELGPLQIAAGIAAAAITTLGAVSLPGQVSFVTSIAPICLAMGIPIEPLAILIAVETIPDIFRTVGNVTMDVAVTATVAERTEGGTAALSEQVAVPADGNRP
jgi:Na+/H+-dicarboxylate symporter